MSSGSQSDSLCSCLRAEHWRLSANLAVTPLLLPPPPSYIYIDEGLHTQHIADRWLLGSVGSARCWLTTGPNSGLTYSTYIYNFINGWVKCSIRWWLVSLELLVKSIILHGTLLASRLSDLGSLFDVRPSLLCLFPLSFLSPPKFSRISLISRIASEVDLSSHSLARFIACLQAVVALTYSDASRLKHSKSLHHLDVLLVSLHVTWQQIRGLSLCKCNWLQQAINLSMGLTTGLAQSSGKNFHTA